VHTGVNTVKINTEAAGSNITEYHPLDDKPHAGMFDFPYPAVNIALYC